MLNPDLDVLLEAVLPFARQMLDEHGNFYPFAASMRQDFTIAMVASTDGDDHPAANDVLDMLETTLQKLAKDGEIRAAAVCSNVSITPEESGTVVDAIRVSLDHVDGEAVDIILPYERQADGELSFGELGAGHLDSYLFP